MGEISLNFRILLYYNIPEKFWQVCVQCNNFDEEWAYIEIQEFQAQRLFDECRLEGTADNYVLSYILEKSLTFSEVDTWCRNHDFSDLLQKVVDMVLRIQQKIKELIPEDYLPEEAKNDSQI